MPNYVKVELRADKNVLDALAVTPDQRGEVAVDFNRVILMPSIDDPVFTAIRHEYKRDDGQVASIGYGFDGYSPLDWAREHWGTKWNASNGERPADGVLRFETAWSAPSPVLAALSAKHPGTRIEVRYADEDHGYNLGDYVLLNGESVEGVTPQEGTTEACDFAAQLWFGKSYAELQAEWEAEYES